MAGYLPLFQPGAAVTFDADAAITGGQLVAAVDNAVRHVAPAAADSAAVVGVASRDAAAGQKVTVYLLRHGVHRVEALAPITAGAKVYAGAGGKVAASGTNPIGIALTTTAPGDLVEFA